MPLELAALSLASTGLELCVTEKKTLHLTVGIYLFLQAVPVLLGLKRTAFFSSGITSMVTQIKAVFKKL